MCNVQEHGWKNREISNMGMEKENAWRGTVMKGTLIDVKQQLAVILLAACDGDLADQPQSIATFIATHCDGTEVLWKVWAAGITHTLCHTHTHIHTHKYKYLQKYIWSCLRVGFQLPFGVNSSRVVSGAGETIPGTVRVSGQTAIGAFWAIEVTLMQCDLGHTRFWPDIQPLLWAQQHEHR